MRKAILIEPQLTQIVEEAPPPVGERDVRVRVRTCGVCASELHGWDGDGGRYPRQHGHEVMGVVEEIGPGVSGVAPGDRVTGLFGRGFAEFAVAPVDRVVPVPEGLSDEAAIGEPLSCVISAARRTRVELGDRLAVVGLGYMGLLMLQALRLKGPARLIAVDPRAEARERALALGADEAYAPNELPESDHFTRWEQLGSDAGVDVAVEASGTPAGLTLAGRLARPHGVLSVTGWHQGGARQVDFELWGWKALEVLNAHERRADYQMDCMRRGLALAAAGKLDPGGLVSHRFPLTEVDAAFRALHDKPPGFCKAVVAP